MIAIYITIKPTKITIKYDKNYSKSANTAKKLKIRVKFSPRNKVCTNPVGQKFTPRHNVCLETGDSHHDGW